MKIDKDMLKRINRFAVNNCGEGFYCRSMTANMIRIESLEVIRATYRMDTKLCYYLHEKVLLKGIY